MKTRILLCMMALWGVYAAAQPRVADNGFNQMMTQHPVLVKAPTAQDPTIILNNLKRGKDRINTVLKNSRYNGKFSSHSFNNITKVSENGVNVTVKWIYDHEAFRGFLSDVLIVNKDFKIAAFPPMDEETFDLIDSTTVVVPIGCYDVIARFFDFYGKPYLVIKEDVNIEDGVTLSMDVAEATNTISVLATNPQGETFRLPEYQDDNLITEGNTHAQSYDRIIVSKKYGEIHETIYNTNYTEVDGPLGGDCCVNNVSDNYMLLEEIITFSGNNDLFFNYFCVDDLSSSCTITDDANVYAHSEERFVPGLFENESGVAGSAFMAGSSQLYMNNHNIGGHGYYGWGPGYEIGCNPISISYHIDKECSFQIGDNTFNLVAAPKIAYIDEEEGIELEHYGAPMFFNGSEMEYMVGVNAGNYRYDSELKEPALSHPKFSCVQSQKQSDYGFGVPTLSTEIGQMYADDLWPFIQCRYYGQLGEMSQSDVLTPTASGKLNGEEICNSVRGLRTFARQIFNENTNSGEVEISLNLTNRIFEDNIEGSNLTVMKFDLSREDRTPPTLQLLQFRDINDNVTEVFSDFSQATFRLCCGDFVENAIFDEGWGGYRYWFECKPVTAVVEYAPNGSDDWQEVACEQQPEYDLMPFYGHYFEGSLAELNGSSANGWYDMRITLTDESGNSQTQTISPAFRIEHAQSSVATLRDNNAHEVARYNLAGQRVDANATGVVIIKMSDGTARKVLN